MLTEYLSSVTKLTANQYKIKRKDMRSPFRCIHGYSVNKRHSLPRKALHVFKYFLFENISTY